MIEVWAVEKEDVEECVQIAASRYADIDINGSLTWGYSNLNNERLILIRTENIVMATVLQRYFYKPKELTANTIFLCARRGNYFKELLFIVKATINIAQQRGATRFGLNSTTEVDFEPLAKRLGLNIKIPGYEGII